MSLYMKIYMYQIFSKYTFVFLSLVTALQITKGEVRQCKTKIKVHVDGKVQTKTCFSFFAYVTGDEISVGTIFFSFAYR